MAEKSSGKFLYAVIAVLVLALGVVAYQNYLLPQQKAAQQEKAIGNVKKIYETITENPVDVVSVKEESGMYRVTLGIRDASGNRQLIDLLVTTDGTYFTDRAFDSNAFLARLNKEKAFAECLASKRLLVLGQSTDVNTQQQLQILGSFYRKVYVDCVGANLQLCQQAGITQVPTTIYNNATYVGVQTLAFYEQLTGCKMG